MFIERTSRPTKEKFYIKKPNGYSKCKLGRGIDGIPDKNSNVLPDNFNYICGRVNEIVSSEKMKYFSGTFNIKDYFNKFECGSVPELGAIAVWEKGNSTQAAIVEKILDKNTIAISYSVSCGEPFILEYVSLGEDNNWTEGSILLKGYKLIRFMYYPEIEKTYETYSVKKPKKKAKVDKKEFSAEDIEE